MRRLDCHDRLEELRSEYWTAFRSLSLLIRIVEEQPRYLRAADLELIEIRKVAGQLHDVYFSRIFAHFESSIRDYWRTEVRATDPMAKALIAAVAARESIPEPVLDTVQAVRGFRNFLMHGGRGPGMRFTIDEASHHLNSYISWLPLKW